MLPATAGLALGGTGDADQAQISDHQPTQTGGSGSGLGRTWRGPALAAATFASLYGFCAQTGCSDGQRPRAGLFADDAGNLFGTTQFGGANGQGTVFELAKDAKTASGFAGAVSVLYSFSAQAGCTDGVEPLAVVRFDTA
jgi:uncharacterized repeat protein (TIGR03803 family)